MGGRKTKNRQVKICYSNDVSFESMILKLIGIFLEINKKEAENGEEKRNE